MSPRRSIAEAATALEALVLLGLTRFAILVLPFRWLAPHLGHPEADSRLAESPNATATIGRIRWALEAAGRRTPWTSTCLARALAGRIMLHRRGLTSTLTLGVAPGMAAHAWLRCGAEVVCGGEEAANFTAVARFADDPDLERP